MLTIYHIEARRSNRVVWLMEELGLDYALVFRPKDIAGSLMAIKALHPLGAAPLIRDGDELLLESGAILEYIVNRHGGGRFGVPVQAQAYPHYLQWMHFAEGSAMARMITELTLAPLLAVTPPETAPLSRIFTGSTRRMLEYFELWLGKRPYFAGDAFSAADIMMHMAVNIALRAAKADSFPNAAAWRARVEARPAYGRMIARALPNGPPPSISGWPDKTEA